MTDKEMFKLMKEKLYTPVLGDILDQMGYSHQFLPAYIQPLKDDMKVVGRVCTVLEYDVYEAQEKPFGYLTEALDQLKENEVYVATGAHNSALWGELLTATAKARGAVGAVLDGYTRDTPQVLSQDFPVFAKARWAQDSSIRTYVASFRCPIEIGGVVIHDQDVIFGDIDGAIAIPAAEAYTVLLKAEGILKREVGIRDMVNSGLRPTEVVAQGGYF